MLVAVLAAVLAATTGCARAEPPPPELAGGSPAVAPLPPPPPSSPTTTPSPTTSSAVAVASGPESDAGQTPPGEPPASLDDPGALPQTRVRPAADGAAFEAGARALWDAIVNDQPERAAAFFFPLKAYEQVKAIPHPASDWRHRLFAAYVRDIHAAHRRLGAHAAEAKLVGLEVPSGGGRWVEPDEESNKLGYFRVYGAKLRYEIDGAARAIDVKSLISWRGEWYVVHLAGFK